ncbi:MAG TPA: ABC transporter substrate-binding protein [Pseudolabrys sp.]|jgi:NitT/TauT family transport system substrate-binding protein|nr:ABC transporter substrate-binding protein [Pseudolabrys sp.]
MVHIRRLTAFFTLALCVVLAGAAQAETKVRFSLDWIPGSVHSPFFIALYKGYYKAEGLDVAIDRGKGSVALVQQLATGVYDIGYPDISVLTDFDAKNPDKAFPEVMVGYEQAPAAIVVLKESGISTPKQLEGHVLGASANDATFKLFPTFAQHAGIDMSKVKVQYIDPKLRETLLAKKQVDAIIGQVFNTKLELKAKGVDPSKVNAFLYRDYGLDLYGNGLAASPEFLKAHPDAVKGFIRATLKGVRDMVKDPEEAVKMTLKFEPLLNPNIERDRLKLAMECCIITPNVLKNGFGGVDMARLQRGIDILAASYKLPRTPKADEIFDPRYLPAEKERMVK